MDIRLSRTHDGYCIAGTEIMIDQTDDGWILYSFYDEIGNDWLYTEALCDWVFPTLRDLRTALASVSQPPPTVSIAQSTIHIRCGETSYELHAYRFADAQPYYTLTVNGQALMIFKESDGYSIRDKSNMFATDNRSATLRAAVETIIDTV